MELEAMVEYLVALALPIWLLVELVTHPRRSKQPEKSLEPHWLRGGSISRASSTASRARATKLAQPRRVA
jgi:hypothetical protein